MNDILNVMNGPYLRYLHLSSNQIRVHDYRLDYWLQFTMSSVYSSSIQEVV